MRWVVVMLLAWSTVVAADTSVTPAAKKEAAAHRKTAHTLAAKHKLDQAIKELVLSVNIAFDSDAMFELGQLYDQVPDEDLALAAYQRVMDGKHVAEAQTRMEAIIAARTQRAAAAAAKAEADAKEKAEQEARAAAIAAADAERKADEERRRSEAEDRQRRMSDGNLRDAQLRIQLEQRANVTPIAVGAEHRRRGRHDLGVKLVEVGLACIGVAGVSAAFAAISDAHDDRVGVEAISTNAAYGFAGAAALTIVVGTPLIVF